MPETPKNKIILSHWTQGGTGLTNFRPSELPRFEEALKRYGREGIVICSKPMRCNGNECPTDHSLHLLRECEANVVCDASDFWEHFKQITT